MLYFNKYSFKYSVFYSVYIGAAWFFIDQLGLKDLHFETWDNETDHTWHEFISIEYTDESATETRTFKQFLEQIAVQHSW